MFRVVVLLVPSAVTKILLPGENWVFLETSELMLILHYSIIDQQVVGAAPGAGGSFLSAHCDVGPSGHLKLLFNTQMK